MEAIAREDGHWDIQRRIRLYLKRMLEAAKENRLVPSNAAKGIKIPKKPKTDRRPLTKTEKYAISAADFTLKQKAFIYLLLYCGLRRGEALALRISDVDLVEDMLTISRSLDLKGTDKNVRVTKTENGIFQKQGLSYGMTT